MSKQQLATVLAGGLGLAALHRFSPGGPGRLRDRGRSIIGPSLSRSRVFQWLHELSRDGIAEPTRLAARAISCSAWPAARAS